MKKALLALTILGFTFLSAEAQTTTTTTRVKTETTKTAATDTPNYAKNYKVCKGKATYYVCGDKPSGKKRTTTTTKTKRTTTAPMVATTTGTPGASTSSENAKNFKVCKSSGKYHICDQHPNSLNSVPAPKGKVATGKADPKPITKTTTITENGVIATTSTQTFAEQPVVPQSQSIADQSNNTLAPVTVTGHVDTITNANAPYHGKNSPQYDGLQKNRARNLNTAPQSPNSLPITNK